jgi:hypothetical protein
MEVESELECKKRRKLNGNYGGIASFQKNILLMSHGAKHGPVPNVLTVLKAGYKICIFHTAATHKWKAINIVGRKYISEVCCCGSSEWNQMKIDSPTPTCPYKTDHWPSAPKSQSPLGHQCHPIPSQFKYQSSISRPSHPLCSSSSLLLFSPKGTFGCWYAFAFYDHNRNGNGFPFPQIGGGGQSSTHNFNLTGQGTSRICMEMDMEMDIVGIVNI